MRTPIALVLLVASACSVGPTLEADWRNRTRIGDVPPGKLELSFYGHPRGEGSIDIRDERFTWPWERFQWLIGEEQTLLIFPLTRDGSRAAQPLIFSYEFDGYDELVLHRDPTGPEAKRLRRIFGATSGTIDGPARFVWWGSGYWRWQ